MNFNPFPRVVGKVKSFFLAKDLLDFSISSEILASWKYAAQVILCFLQLFLWTSPSCTTQFFCTTKFLCIASVFFACAKLALCVTLKCYLRLEAVRFLYLTVFRKIWMARWTVDLWAIDSLLCWNDFLTLSLWSASAIALFNCMAAYRYN